MRWITTSRRRRRPAGNSWYDPFGDPRINYGNSAYNLPNRFVGYAIYSLPGLSGHAWYTYLTNGWKIDGTFQMGNGLPYTAGATGFTGPGVVSDWNGSGGPTLIPGIGINSYKTPRKIVIDARVEKDFRLYKNYELQLFAQMFNVANHQNYDGINSTAYKLGGTGANWNGDVPVDVPAADQQQQQWFPLHSARD